MLCISSGSGAMESMMQGVSFPRVRPLLTRHYPSRHASRQNPIVRDGFNEADEARTVGTRGVKDIADKEAGK